VGLVERTTKSAVLPTYKDVNTMINNQKCNVEKGVECNKSREIANE